MKRYEVVVVLRSLDISQSKRFDCGAYNLVEIGKEVVLVVEDIKFTYTRMDVLYIPFERILEIQVREFNELEFEDEVQK